MSSNQGVFSVRNYKEVAAHLTPPEREWLKVIAEEIAEQFPASPVSPLFVHIGVLYGGSLHCSRAGAPNAPLVGVDLEVRALRDDPQAILLEGDSVVLGWNFSTPIHFLFVDGGHDYASVKMDVEAWGRLVVPGGIMAYHDSNFTPVRRAIDETSADWEEVEISPATNEPHTTLRIRAFRRLPVEEAP